ncbi:hypothetical protein BDZ97DRAFT_1765732 [Flammula alnicola]|nr:hypothetical protein BDZ97DRAFT_1765732 [Flammula alnicola]
MERDGRSSNTSELSIRWILEETLRFSCQIGYRPFFSLLKSVRWIVVVPLSGIMGVDGFSSDTSQLEAAVLLEAALAIASELQNAVKVVLLSSDRNCEPFVVKYIQNDAAYDIPSILCVLKPLYLHDISFPFKIMSSNLSLLLVLFISSRPPPVGLVLCQINRDAEREKARGRMQRRRKNCSTEELTTQKERHREAQARYREANRAKLRLKAWQYRIKQKRANEIAKDEEEYQRLMALELEDCE